MRIATRAAALVVAVGLVVGATVLRDSLVDDDGGTTATGAGDVVLACPSDLSRLCDALDGVDGLATAPTSTAVSAEATTTGGLEGPWLVTASWADVVDDGRARSGGAPLLRSAVVARSPVVVGVWEDRLVAFGELCAPDGTAFPLACLDGVADQRWESLGFDARWGRVNVGHLDPTTTTGLTVTASVVGAVAGTDFGQAELRDPSVVRSLRAVEAFAVAGDPASGGYLRSMVVTGESAGDVAVTVEAEAVGLDLARQPGNVIVVLPAVPALDVELVVVADDQDALDAAVARLDRASGQFEPAGWRVGDVAPAGSPVGELPAPAPRPDGPSLTALLLFWDELAG